MANLADNCVGVCCLATKRVVPRASQRGEDQNIRPTDIAQEAHSHRSLPWGLQPLPKPPEPRNPEGKREGLWEKCFKVTAVSCQSRPDSGLLEVQPYILESGRAWASLGSRAWWLAGSLELTQDREGER